MRGFSCGRRLIHMCYGYLNILVRSVGLRLHCVEHWIMEYLPPIVVGDCGRASHCGRRLRLLREAWRYRREGLVVIGPDHASRKSQSKNRDAHSGDNAAMIEGVETRLQHRC